MSRSPRPLRRVALLGLAVAAVAVPVLAVTISALKPPPQEMTERISTDKGTVTVTRRPSAGARDLGCKPYRGTMTESFVYQVKDPRGRASHLVAGAEIVTPDPLYRIRDYYLKALRGSQAKAVGNRKVGRYRITRDKGNEAIVIEAWRPAGESSAIRSTIRVRRVIQGVLNVTPKPMPLPGAE